MGPGGGVCFLGYRVMARESITAISAIILLVTPQFLLITVQINEFAEKGSYGIACAFATILIAITYGSVLLMNLFMKYFGTSRKFKEAN